MNRLKLLFLLSGLILFSCNKTEDTLPKGPQNKDPLAGFDTRSISVNFPSSSQLDLAEAQLLSWDKLSPLQEDNTGKVVNPENEPAFAYLFDKENHLLLVGLMDKTNTTLDLTSTAKVLLYWGLSGPFFEAELGEAFFKEVEAFPIWPEWKSLVLAAWEKDPYFLKNEAIGQELGKLIDKTAPNLRKAATTADTKASDLLVNGDIRSGLQVSQIGLSQFEVANTYRRRVKGFLYKTKHTLDDGSIEALNEFPGSSKYTDPDMEIEIPTTTGITSFSGTVYDYLLGETEKSFRVKSEPVSIPLDLNEKDATWQLRTVGMGKSSLNINQAESAASTKIMMLTFTLDFVVPLIGDALAVKGAASKNTGAPKTEQDFWEALIVTVTGYVDKMPEVAQKIEKGELTEAITDFYNIGYNQFGSIFFEDMVRVAAEIIWENAPSKLTKPSMEDFKQSAARKAKILATVDLILKGSDYARKVHDIKSSNQIDIFEIVAKEIEINLVPRITNVSPENNLKLTAHIKSTIADGQVIEYEWSTTGKYGHLYDDIHKGKNFSSSKKEVSYFCSAQSGKIPENATDTVTVTTYIKQGQNRTRVGSDKAVIKISDRIVFNVGWEIYVPVTERETEMSPSGIEYFISLRGLKANFNFDGEVDHFELRVVRADGTKGTAVTKTGEQLKKGGGYEYFVRIGSIVLINTYSESVRDEWVDRFTKEVEAKRDVYSSLEVTVFPK